MIITFEDFLFESNGRLMVYRNKENFNTYTVFKGNDLYSVKSFYNKSMEVKYLGKVDRNKYSISGTLVSGKQYKGFFIAIQKAIKILG
jgi:hypothetical protein